ncbi:MAG: hypothetical protein F4Y45_12990 [Acidobacteria bacterium]|nr:hypothetical protein [Acidobacteriota bacterium]MYJ04635.1 hypothetical protein [Acidobacteriota bacterium]
MPLPVLLLVWLARRRRWQPGRRWR